MIGLPRLPFSVHHAADPKLPAKSGQKIHHAALAVPVIVIQNSAK